MAKEIYILQTGSYNAYTKRYEFNDLIPFSKKKTLEEHIAERVEVNKGYGISRYKSVCGDTEHFDYVCESAEGREMKVRYVIYKKELL